MRLLLRLDAGLELVLAALCVLLGVGSWVLPSWLSLPLLLSAGGVLVVVAALLWWLSLRPERAVVRAVAVANGVTTLGFLAWAAAGFGSGGQLRVLVGLVAVVLGALATAQYVRAGRPVGMTAHESA